MTEEGIKQCKKCLQFLVLTNFSKLKKGNKFNSYCKLCSIDVFKKYYEKNKSKHVDTVYALKQKKKIEKQQYVVSWLKENPCVDCGNSDIRVLEFDHVKGKKRANISVLISGGFSLTSLQLEIAKCEVRCANCHRIKSLQIYKNCYRVENLTGEIDDGDTNGSEE